MRLGIFVSLACLSLVTAGFFAAWGPTNLLGEYVRVFENGFSFSELLIATMLYSPALYVFFLMVREASAKT